MRSVYNDALWNILHNKVNISQMYIGRDFTLMYTVYLRAWEFHSAYAGMYQDISLMLNSAIDIYVLQILRFLMQF